MTDAAFGLGDERFAEWSLSKTVIDLHGGAEIFHFAGRSGFERDAEIVQASRSRQTGVERSVENIMPVEQESFHVLEREAL